jgi:N-methylhydantoinase B
VTALDPVTLAVLNGRFVQIADEMDATLYRSAFNPIIAEAHDACHGLYHAETGATLVQGTSGLPIFVGAMAFAVKAVIDLVARDGGLDGGDIFIFNDPYDGGTHLNDFRLVRPLMRGGKLFAWIASVGHWLDVGGAVPGGYNPKATESYQEGILIPPVKLVRAGVLQQDVIDILSANTRVPQSNWGDLNGQLNALDLGERRLHLLLDEYGDDTIAAALAALSARAEALMRANVAALPDGTYSYEDFLDNDGVTDRPLRIALDLTIAGDGMTLDFSRSAPPCDGPLNIARSTTIAACYVALKHIFTDVPANAWRRSHSSFRTPRCSASSRRGRSPAIPRPSCALSTSSSAPSPRSRRSAPMAARSPPSMRCRSPAGAPTTGVGSCSASSAAGSAAIRRATASITATIRSRPPPSRRWRFWNRFTR